MHTCVLDKIYQVKELLVVFVGVVAGPDAPKGEVEAVVTDGDASLSAADNTKLAIWLLCAFADVSSSPSYSRY